MPRPIFPTLALLVAAASAACSDAERIIATPPADAPSGILYPVADDGEPTYYEYATQITGTGGLPGWENPNEAHSRDLTEVYRWSAFDGEWHVENRFATPETMFESNAQEPGFDVTRGLKSTASFSATARTGATLSNPDAVPVMDLLPDGTGASASREATGGAALSRSGADGLSPLAAISAHRSEAVAGAGRPEVADVRSAGVDRRVVTAGGRARELARLRAQFGEGTRGADGGMEFGRSHGTGEVKLLFNPAIGAVTRITVLEGGKRRFETVRRYRREGDVWMLDTVETQNFDANGKPAGRTSEVIRAIELR